MVGEIGYGEGQKGSVGKLGAPVMRHQSGEAGSHTGPQIYYGTFSVLSGLYVPMCVGVWGFKTRKQGHVQIENQ